MTPKPDITIRLKPAGMSWDDVRRLLWQAHRLGRERGMDFGSGRLAPEELERRVGTPGLCLIAYADGVPAGTASLDIRDLQTGGQTVRCGLCRALGVLPQYAGLGIGTLLMQEREKPARALLCRRLHVATHPRNQRAIAGAAGPPSGHASGHASGFASGFPGGAPFAPFLRLGYRRPDPDRAAFVKELG